MTSSPFPAAASQALSDTEFKRSKAVALLFNRRNYSKRPKLSLLFPLANVHSHVHVHTHTSRRAHSTVKNRERWNNARSDELCPSHRNKHAISSLFQACTDIIRAASCMCEREKGSKGNFKRRARQRRRDLWTRWIGRSFSFSLARHPLLFLACFVLPLNRDAGI